MEREYIGVAQAFGAAGCMFGSRITVTVNSSGSSTGTIYIPAGAWICETDAHTTVKFTYDNGTTWVTLVGASLAAVVPADGFLVAFVGDTTGGVGHRSQILNWQ